MADSAWKTLVSGLLAQLALILEGEERAVPAIVYGRGKWSDDERNRVPRMRWTQPGGRFTKNVPLVTQDPEVPSTPLGARIAMSQMVLWHATDEQAEHVLERLWLASQRMPEPARFSWEQAQYEYPTEEAGEQLQSGQSIITLMLPILVPVSSIADNEGDLVEVEGSQCRSGIESPEGEDLEDTDYEIDRIDPQPWAG